MEAVRIRWEEVMDRRYVVCEDTSGYSEFEVTMLEENQVSGLIDPEIYSINGVREYYFNITDKVSFDEMLSRRAVGVRELRKLFISINQTLECMRDYLIAADIILLDSKFIYFSEERVWFVYDLSERREFGRELVLLVKSILNKIDYDNRELVCRCYKIFDEVSCSPGDLKKIIDVFEEPLENISVSESGSASGNGALDVLGEGGIIEKNCCIESAEPKELILKNEVRKHQELWAGRMICLGIVFLVILIEIVRNIMCVYC